MLTILRNRRLQCGARLHCIICLCYRGLCRWHLGERDKISFRPSTPQGSSNKPFAFGGAKPYRHTMLTGAASFKRLGPLGSLARLPLPWGRGPSRSLFTLLLCSFSLGQCYVMRVDAETTPQSRPPDVDSLVHLERSEAKASALPPLGIKLHHARLVKLSERGIAPAEFTMTVAQAVVFFLNASRESLVTIEVDYNGKYTHCATKNLQVDPNNRVYSKVPFAPGNFASLCFHDPGDYPFRVHGLSTVSRGASEGLSGIIHVIATPHDEDVTPMK